MQSHTLSLQTPHGNLHGQISHPPGARAAILLARAQHVAVDTIIAANLANRGYAMLSMELLTHHEAQFADATHNTPRLAQRLIDILDLVRRNPLLADLPFAIYATGDSSPAAVKAAAQRDEKIRALACHGGYIDRAGKQSLELLAAPLLMLADPADQAVKASYERAKPFLHPPLEFHELGPAEDPVMRVAAWFASYLNR